MWEKEKEVRKAFTEFDKKKLKSVEKAIEIPPWE